MNASTIFNIPINDLSREQVFQRVDDALHSNRAEWIVTLNPEILLHAHRHSEYAAVLKKATIRIPDGVGIRLVSRVSSVVPGVDIAQYVLQRAEQGRLRVVCVVRADGRSSVDAVLEAVQHRAPHAVVRGVALPLDQRHNVGLVKTISEFQPEIILVGLGFPYQEQWLSLHLSSIRSAVIGIGVGGTFDYWTGVAQRAPQWMQRIGIEWLWRLICEPRRIGRIFNAVAVFPFLAIIDRLWPQQGLDR